MSFLLVGVGLFDESKLVDKLANMGINDGKQVIQEAIKKKVTVRGRYKIMLFR